MLIILDLDFQDWSVNVSGGFGLDYSVVFYFVAPVLLPKLLFRLVDSGVKPFMLKPWLPFDCGIQNIFNFSYFAIIDFLDV